MPAMVKRGSGAEQFDFPRRNCIDQLIPAEEALRLAVLAVEDLPADVRLTEIVVRLAELRDRLADWAEDYGYVKPQ